MSIPAKMFALVVKNEGFSGTAEGAEIKDIEPYLDSIDIDVPEPQDGQVLIKLIRANINPSDLYFIKGEYGIPRKAGVPAGFEAVGQVVAAGKGGEKLIGQRVAFIASASGAWAEYSIADAMMCVPLRDDVKDEDGATIFVNPLTAMAMYEDIKKSGAESFIMTAAASQLCKLVTGLAKLDGMSSISVVRNDEQIPMLKELGAAHVLNCKSDTFMKELGGLMKSEKPRVLLDAVADQLSSDIFFAMPSRARWVVYGKLATQLPSLTEMGQFIFMSKRIEGFWLTQWMQTTPPQDQIAAIARVQELFATGQWKTDVRASISLRDAAKELPAALNQMNTGKVMLVP